MADPYSLETLTLAGFRAYLQPTTFDFRKKPCLAIFAPNGAGKSSIVDAIEFILSPDGTLERLGQRAMNTKAGPVALAHNLAEEIGVEPSVTISIASGKNTLVGERKATGTTRPVPPVATALNRCFAVSPIIRGHSLRRFVEDQTPEERYAEIAKWLQLSPLVEIQKNLRVLRSKVKAFADSDEGLRQIDRQLWQATDQGLKVWDPTAVIDHCNDSILKTLDQGLILEKLDIKDAVFVEVSARSDAEDTRVGLQGLRQIRNAAANLWSRTEDGLTGEAVLSGAIPTFDNAVTRLLDALSREADERAKAADATFNAVWDAAQHLFADDARAPQICPVCLTPIAQSVAGSAKDVRRHIEGHLEGLRAYAHAKKEKENASTAAARAQSHLLGALPTFISLLEAGNEFLKAALGTYRLHVDEFTSGRPPSSEQVGKEIESLIAQLDRNIAEIEAKQGNHTYSGAKRKLEFFIDLQTERALLLRTQDELKKLSESLILQSATISGEIREKIQYLLDYLRVPVNDNYKIIQGEMAHPIRLELPPEDGTNQQKLSLLIDFAENRKGVQPGGYLSDSQIHSVALALRLAAIKRFNQRAPIVVLDDIVTSYDADHRRAIAGLIAMINEEGQFLITTHDERFFNYLKDQLNNSRWSFVRIMPYDPKIGPRFADHQVSDALIEARWVDGKSAANEMRQAEEEWLLAICRDFGVSVRIRTVHKPYSYERSELASALGAFLKEARLTPMTVPGVENRFLASLVLGEIENFGSHFQDSPYGNGSIGDERTRWKEFKVFQRQFVCKKCKRTRFKRPTGLKSPVCAHEKCEAQFEFEHIPYD